MTMKLHPQCPLNTAPLCKLHPACLYQQIPSSLGFPVPELLGFLPASLTAPLPLSGLPILSYRANGGEGSAVLTGLALSPRHTDPCKTPVTEGCFGFPEHSAPFVIGGLDRLVALLRKPFPFSSLHSFSSLRAHSNAVSLGEIFLTHPPAQVRSPFYPLAESLRLSFIIP